VSVRRATVDDEPLLRELWEEFEQEVPSPPELVETWAEEWADVREDIEERGVVLLAEDEDGVVGYARFGLRYVSAWYLATAYVRPRARRQGVLRALLAAGLAEGRARGATDVGLEVLVSNEAALATWQSLGFRPVQSYMSQPLADLEQRLEQSAGATFGSIHVQTDDRDQVEREVAKYRRRIAGPGANEVTEPRQGWVAVYDELLERDPALLRRLARELSVATGSVVCVFVVERDAVVGYSLYDRGSSVDDYQSVPEFHGPLPPGDVVSLEANPRVVQRLTGADPAAVRAAARTAANPAELPPVRELAAQIAATMGIAGADRGYAG
jgi:ribosomal protein S18 acetylase RimI-like enzyme